LRATPLRLRPYQIALAAALLLGTGAQAAPAPCRFDDRALVCPVEASGSAGARAMRVIESLAAAEPRALFGDPFAAAEAKFSRPGARERLRVSLERLNRTLERGRAAIEWRRRHGRFDRAEYLRWLAKYQEAVGTYREGVWFYKALMWVAQDGA